MASVDWAAAGRRGVRPSLAGGPSASPGHRDRSAPPLCRRDSDWGSAVNHAAWKGQARCTDLLPRPRVTACRSPPAAACLPSCPPAGQPLQATQASQHPAMHRACFILALLACTLACAKGAHSPSGRGPARRLLQTGSDVTDGDLEVAELFEDMFEFPSGELDAHVFGLPVQCQDASAAAALCHRLPVHRRRRGVLPQGGARPLQTGGEDCERHGAAVHRPPVLGARWQPAAHRQVCRGL